MCDRQEPANHSEGWTTGLGRLTEEQLQLRKAAVEKLLKARPRQRGAAAFTALGISVTGQQPAGHHPGPAAQPDTGARPHSGQHDPIVPGLQPRPLFAHEDGHDIGLPDPYNTAGGDNGTGFWTLMSAGSWPTPSRHAARLGQASLS